MRRSFIFSLLFFLIVKSFAQIGGENTFAILDFNPSVRTAAMGGELISIIDNDVDVAVSNPALLNSRMHQKISFSFIDYFTDVNAVAVNYATEIEKLGMLFFGIKALNYGQFILTDETGVELGEFSANEQVLTTGVSKKLNNQITIGVNLNLIHSKLEQYLAIGLSSNIGLSYHNEERRICFSVLAKDFGRQIQSYTDEKEKLPFQIQIGVSKQLAHMPFRFSIVAHHLNRFDISNNYLEPTITDPISGLEVVNEDSFGKKTLRHLVLGGELNPGRKNLFFRGGFNFQRRQDMQLSTRPLLVGFSWGLGLRISKFQLNYSRVTYHLSGASNNFSFSTNLSLFGL